MIFEINFEALGLKGYPEGTYFKVVKREDGVVLVRRFDPSKEKD